MLVRYQVSKGLGYKRLVCKKGLVYKNYDDKGLLGENMVTQIPVIKGISIKKVRIMIKVSNGHVTTCHGC